MPRFESLLYEVESDGIALITLNRPEQLNSMSIESISELIDALSEADGDPEVRAVILTGAGRTFSAGTDLSAGPETFAPIASTENGASTERDWGGVLVLRIFEMLKPTIAAINGASVGVGVTMSLPCDVRIASTEAKFGFVFARRGIITDGCASWFLPRIVGISTSLMWNMTGELISSSEALAAGLVSSLHEPDDLVPAARAIALRMTSQSAPVSVSIIRQLLWHGLTENHPMDAHRYESALFSALTTSPDVREGVESFLERRPAHFSGTVPNDLPRIWPVWEKSTF
jgi:enoyl-CoA hydratase/carnithine racemase